MAKHLTGHGHPSTGPTLTSQHPHMMDHNRLQLQSQGTAHMWYTHANTLRHKIKTQKKKNPKTKTTTTKSFLHPQTQTEGVEERILEFILK